MANLEGLIEGVVRGDDFDVLRSVDNIEEGQFLVKAWFTVKENFWDAEPVFQKVITESSIVGQGDIDNSNISENISDLRITITKDDSVKMHEFFRYVYDIQVKTNAGKIYTPEFGTIIAHARVTENEE